MKRLLLLSITLTLSGCLGSGLSNNLSSTLGLSGLGFGGDNVYMTPEHALRIKTAGVISFIEPQARVHYVGPSFKESNLEYAVLPDWNAKATVTDLMEARLKQKGFRVIPIETNIKFADAYSSSASFAEPMRVRERVLAAGKAHNVDMVVVVYRQLIKDFISKSSQKVISYGLYNRLADDVPYAYSVVHIEALNTEKGYVLGKSNATVKLELVPTAWQENFETDKGQVRLNSHRADYVRENVAKALTDSVLIAAQESGISN